MSIGDGGASSGEGSNTSSGFPEFEHVLGLPLVSFGKLDVSLAEALWDWRLGWTPLAAQLPALDNHPRCLVKIPHSRGVNKFIVVG
jgi:hypothetical protein